MCSYKGKRKKAGLLRNMMALPFSLRSAMGAQVGALHLVFFSGWLTQPLMFATLRGLGETRSTGCAFFTFFFFFRPLSLIIGNASCFYSFFCIGGVRGQWTNHLIIKKCHFSAFQIREKKKVKWGEEKGALPGSFFFFTWLFFYEQVAVFAFF